MAIEIVDLPIENGGSFHSYVSLPEGNCNLYDYQQYGIIMRDIMGIFVAKKTQVGVHYERQSTNKSSKTLG